MIILGIDQSLTSSGFAVFDTANTCLLHIETFHTTPNKELAWYDDVLRRAKEISERINYLCTKYKVGFISMESPSLASHHNTARLMVLFGSLISSLPTSYMTLSPNELKKAITGFGNATKEEMIEEVKKLPIKGLEALIEVKSKKKLEDICDAIALSFTLNIYLNE